MEGEEDRSNNFEGQSFPPSKLWHISKIAKTAKYATAGGEKKHNPEVWCN